uniref:Uncharacterized protein n=1 Tax=Arundo donax TaxID=35708 RepID=A0A0A9D416_ARUDO
MCHSIGIVYFNHLLLYLKLANWPDPFCVDFFSPWPTSIPLLDCPVQFFEGIISCAHSTFVLPFFLM